MPRKEAHVTTKVKDVDLVLEAKTKGWQFLLDIAFAIGMQHTEQTLWFGIQYLDKKGHRKWIKDNRYVLDHHLDTRNKPLQFSLQVKVFPDDFSVVEDSVAQVLLYRELRDSIESGELKCPPDKMNVFANLAQENNIPEYMKQARSLEEYGKSYFKLYREDGAQIAVAVSLSEINISCRNETDVIPLQDIKDLKADNRNVCIITGLKSKGKKFKAETPRSCKAAVQVMTNYLEVYRQIQNSVGVLSRSNNINSTNDTHDTEPVKSSLPDEADEASMKGNDNKDIKVQSSNIVKSKHSADSEATPRDAIKVHSSINEKTKHSGHTDTDDMGDRKIHSSKKESANVSGETDKHANKAGGSEKVQTQSKNTEVEVAAVPLKKEELESSLHRDVSGVTESVTDEKRNSPMEDKGNAVGAVARHSEEKGSEESNISTTVNESENVNEKPKEDTEKQDLEESTAGAVETTVDDTTTNVEVGGEEKTKENEGSEDHSKAASSKEGADGSNNIPVDTKTTNMTDSQTETLKEDTALDDPSATSKQEPEQEEENERL